jgi:hypothetical protein
MVTGVLAVQCEDAFVARRGLSAVVYIRMGGAYACCVTQYVPVIWALVFGFTVMGHLGWSVW